MGIGVRHGWCPRTEQIPHIPITHEAIKRISSLFIEALVELPVHIEHDSYTHISEALGDHGRRLASRIEDGHMGVHRRS